MSLEDEHRAMIAAIDQVSLKDRAIAAYADERKEKDKNEAARFASRNEAARFASRVVATEWAFQEIFGVHVPRLSGTCDTIVPGPGLKLRAVFSRDWRKPNIVDGFQLLGTCPDCGADCYSQSVNTLAGLGEQIENFKPGWSHMKKCHHHKQPTPTVGGVLLKALEDYVEEVTFE